MKISFLLPIFFMLFFSSSKAQDSTIVNCSSVLIITENQPILGDTVLPAESILANVSEFGIMLIVETTDDALVEKVHVNLGNSVGDNSLLSTSFSASSNVDVANLIYETYSNYVNVKIGEFTINSILHYSITTEDAQGNLSAVYTGTVSK